MIETDQMSRDTTNPKDLVDRILAIAPILPSQGGVDEQEAKLRSLPSAPNNTPGSRLNVHYHPDNLIDLDSRPPSTAPPEATGKNDSTARTSMHPTPHLLQAPLHQSTVVTAPIGNAPKPANLMDDDDGLSRMNDQMAKMKMHEAMVPQGARPLRRADTETSEVDVFVDAEG